MQIASENVLGAPARRLLALLAIEEVIDLEGSTVVAELHARALRDGLSRELPDYMVPSRIVFVDGLPLSANGKVDRKTLAEQHDRTASEARAPSPPADEVEAFIAGVIRQALRCDAVDPVASFFDLGGDSLTAMRVMSAVNQRYGIELGIAAIFDDPTVRALANQVRIASQLGDALSADPTAEMPTAELREKSLLPPDVRPRRAALASSSRDPEPPRRVLITGATGFVGRHLLRAWLAADDDVEIFALARPNGQVPPCERIERELGLTATESARVRAIEGDLTLPYFGRTASKFAELGEQIDAIVHCGAAVSYAATYKSLRTTNVLGTQEVLRLAAEGHPKPVHLLSSTNIFTSTALLGRASLEEDIALDSFASVYGGYAQTKWASEWLGAQARRRGLDVRVYRPSVISGHTQTGDSNLDDILCRFVKGCIQLGMAPALDAELNIVPIDWVVSSLVELFRMPQRAGDAFHLTHPGSVRIPELVEHVRSYGYPLEIVDFEVWRARMTEVHEDAVENALYPLLPMITQLRRADFFSVKVPAFGRERVAANVSRPEPAAIDRPLVHRYLDALIAQRFLPPTPRGAVQGGDS